MVRKLLLDDIQIDEREEFKRLYFRYHETFCQFAYRYVKSMYIAEGIVQDVYLKALERHIHLRGVEDISKYMFQSIRNQALDYLKHKKIIQKYEEEIVFQFYSHRINSGKYEVDDTILLNKQFKEKAEEVIEKLPDRTRKIYNMSRQEGLTYQEIADFLGISNKTVELHISKSLRILRKHLEL